MQSSSSVANGCQLYVLLIEPREKHFEFIHIICPSRKPHFEEILPILTTQIEEPIFQTQHFTGFCKYEKNRAFTTKIKNGKREIKYSSGDFLLAVPQGYADEDCKLMGDIIVQKNPRIMKWIRKHRKRLFEKQKVKSKDMDVSSSSPVGVEIHPSNRHENILDLPNMLEQDKEVVTLKPSIQSSRDQNISLEYVGKTSGEPTRTTKETKSFDDRVRTENFQSHKNGSMSDSYNFAPKPANIINPKTLKVELDDNSNLKESQNRDKKRLESTFSKEILVIFILFYIQARFSELAQNSPSGPDKTRHRPFDFYGITRVILFIYILKVVQKNWSKIRKKIFRKRKRDRRFYRSPRLTFQRRMG